MNTEKEGQNIIPLNHAPPRYSECTKAMSVEELSGYEEFKGKPESELKAILDTVRTFTEIVFGVWAKQSERIARSATTIHLSKQASKAA